MAVFRKNSNWWIDYSFQGKRYRQKISSRRKDADEESMAALFRNREESNGT
ncbi:MAG: hypothetical protein HOC20_01155 [Chloroflexi bacterium]|nr:hypothetical protein [Chloroflexota bacterium]